MSNGSTMRLTFLGAGSAFTMEGFQSNMLVSIGGRNMLIDCGSDVRFSLKTVGLGPADIGAVYISHQHADHVGGLEWLAFSTFFNPALDRPVMFVNENLAAELWENTLRGGLKSIQGQITALDSYFDVRSIEKNGTFNFEGMEFRTVQTIHVVDGYSFVHSYGLLWNVGKERIFLTTDTQSCPNQIMRFYEDATTIFHDCETGPYKSGVHAHIEELNKDLPAEIKAKMWLYHYGDGPKPDPKTMGFRGFVETGQTFEFSL